MRNLTKIFVLFILLCDFSLVSAAELNKGANKEIFAVKDIPQTITVDYDIGEIAVGNPAIASVVADRPRRRIVLSPLEPGETALLIFDVGGRQRDNISITVTSTDLDQFVKDLKFLFRDIEGLSFRRVGRKVIIEGEVYLKSDLDRIHEVLKGNDFIVDLVTLSQDTQRILARRIKDEIGIQGVEVSTAKDRIVLKGEVLSEDEAARAEKIAQIYTDKGSIVNAIAINPKKSGARPAKLIQVSGYFVELNKAFLRNFNFSWTPIADVKVGYNYSGGRGDFVLSTLVTEFLPKLNMAKALGVARVFENPTVSVKSGEAAKISSGGQVFIPVPNQNGGTTFSQSPIETGVTLDVTATADDRDFVDMRLGIQVSKIGSGTTPNTIQVNKSNVNTVHYVRSGETVALGGVLRSAFSDIKDSPPDQPFSFAPAGSEGPSFTSSLGNIFQVFKSHSVTSDRTMFIVFITPEILGTGRDSGRSIREAMNLNGVEAHLPNSGEDFE